MASRKEYLTQKKFDELTQELENLTHGKRKEIADKLEYAKGLGDLSENAEYQEARDEQAKLEFRISELEDLLKNAEIMNHKKSDVIEAGSTVAIQKKGGDKQSYELVGSEAVSYTHLTLPTIGCV